MKKIRGPMLNNRKTAEKDMKQKMRLFDELGDECLTCLKIFDKTDIKEVSTWRVVVNGEKVSTYCPDCWEKAIETIKDFKERVGDGKPLRND